LSTDLRHINNGRGIGTSRPSHFTAHTCLATNAAGEMIAKLAMGRGLIVAVATLVLALVFGLLGARLAGTFMLPLRG
jgi:hypothetical protein